MKSKVVLGMSGGVDSSVSALLLQKAGYEVIGVTMRLWDDDEVSCRTDHVGCCGSSAAEDALRVAGRLGIAFSTMDFRAEFRRHVVEYFEDEYLRGRTPNPCIACNKYLKWGAMLKRARELNASYIATGHYASVVKCANGRYAVKKSPFSEKDQSYVLYHLSQDELKHTLFPAGEYRKEEIRAMAREAGLDVADKRDSQDICFVPDGDYSAFLRRDIPDRLPGPGDFTDSAGNILGEHTGITDYTIGQRKGLGLSMGRPVFVNRIDAGENRVIVGSNEECFKNRIEASDICHMAEERFDEDKVYTARIRYSHRGSPCHVSYQENGNLIVSFQSPVRAPTPGQAVVLYEDDVIAGGGTII